MMADPVLPDQNQPPIQPPITASTPVTLPPKPKNYSNILIAILLVVIGFLVGMELGEPPLISNLRSKYLGAKPTPTLIPSPTSTPDPTANWKTYTSPKLDVPQSTFVLRYPDSWLLKTNQVTTQPQSLTVVLTKQQDTIEIAQGIGGGGQCIYYDDADYASYRGAGQFFKSYIPISQSVNWRFSEYRDTFPYYTHTVCELNTNRYIDGTKIGWISINLKNQSNLEDILAILSQIRF